MRTACCCLRLVVVIIKAAALNWAGACRNFEAEHTEWSNYHAGVLGKVMSGLQLARFCTASYPMFPNGFNIVKHIIASGYQSSSTTLAPFVLTLETLPLPTHIKKLQLCDTQQP